MKIKFKTASGSEYLIDKDTMEWSRLGDENVRTKVGSLVTWPEITVGEGAILLCPPLVHGDVRLIETTPVVSMETIDA